MNDKRKDADKRKSYASYCTKVRQLNEECEPVRHNDPTSDAFQTLRETLRRAGTLTDLPPKCVPASEGGVWQLPDGRMVEWANPAAEQEVLIEWPTRARWVMYMAPMPYEEFLKWV